MAFLMVCDSSALGSDKALGVFDRNFAGQEAGEQGVANSSKRSTLQIKQNTLLKQAFKMNGEPSKKLFRRNHTHRPTKMMALDMPHSCSFVPCNSLKFGQVQE